MISEEELLPITTPLLVAKNVPPHNCVCSCLGETSSRWLLCFICSLLSLINIYCGLILALVTANECFRDDDYNDYYYCSHETISYCMGILISISAATSFFCFVLSGVFKTVLKHPHTKQCIRISCATQLLLLLFTLVYSGDPGGETTVIMLELLGLTFSAITTIAYHKAIEEETEE